MISFIWVLIYNESEFEVVEHFHEIHDRGEIQA